MRQTVRQVTLKEAEKKTETINLDGPAATTDPKAAAATPSATNDSLDATASSGHSGSRTTLAYVALAAGGAGLVLGGFTGALALGKRGSLDDSNGCEGDVCLPSQRSDVESLDTLRTVSSIGFIAGGVLATTGVMLLLTGRSEAKAQLAAPRLALCLAPNGVSLAGAFQ